MKQGDKVRILVTGDPDIDVYAGLSGVIQSVHTSSEISHYNQLGKPVYTNISGAMVEMLNGTVLSVNLFELETVQE